MREPDGHIHIIDKLRLSERISHVKVNFASSGVRWQQATGYFMTQTKASDSGVVKKKKKESTHFTYYI